MCLAIPCLVKEIQEDEIAIVQVGGEGDTIVKCSLALLAETPKVGDYVLIHAGFAINLMDPEVALDTIKLLKEMAELTGDYHPGNTAFDLD